MDVLVRSMDPDLWARLKARAALERKTLGALLREIITAYLEKEAPS